jgi:hypothetical protein
MEELKIITNQEEFERADEEFHRILDDKGSAERVIELADIMFEYQMDNVRKHMNRYIHHILTNRKEGDKK